MMEAKTNYIRKLGASKPCACGYFLSLAQRERGELYLPVLQIAYRYLFFLSFFFHVLVIMSTSTIFSKKKRVHQRNG